MRPLASLFVITMILGVAGCERRPAEEDRDRGEMEEDAEMDDPGRAQVEAVLGPGGGLVITPNKRACILVPDSSMVGVADSVRIRISRLSPNDSTPPPALPPAFRNAESAGRRVFAPMYDFEVVALPADTAVKRFAKPFYVGLCVWAAPPDLFLAQLAHPDPGNPETLQLFDPLVTAPCSLRCPHGGGPQAGKDARVEAFERWLGGTPFTPTPAFASPAEGIGGKGDGPSPIAAVRDAPGPPGVADTMPIPGDTMPTRGAPLDTMP